MDYADPAGIHRTYVSDIERGKRNPTVTVFEKLATFRSAARAPARLAQRLFTPPQCVQISISERIA